MIGILFLIIAVAVSQAVPAFETISAEWVSFKNEHRKEYSSENEEYVKFQTFLHNMKKIEEHNKLYEQGLVKYKLGINEYTDMTHEEFVNKMTGYKRTNSSHGLKYKKVKANAAEYMDWRQYGFVSAVRNQGACGSCWAFSAVGALEGEHFKRTGQLISLSEQNLLDCAPSYGCDGGSMEDAFYYVIRNGGIDTEQSYPYEGQVDYCRYNPYYSGAYARNYYTLPSGDEYTLLEAVSSVGPISIAIDASLDSLQYYQGGIYYDERCSSYNLDHGVLLVGYGSENGIDYWLIKNSWGTSWGEQGYFKLARNYNNHCGVATDASYPVA